MKHLIARLAFAIFTSAFFPSLTAMESSKNTRVFLPKLLPNHCPGLDAWGGCRLLAQAESAASEKQGECPAVVSPANVIHLACSHHFHTSCLRFYLQKGTLLACPSCATFIDPLCALQLGLLTEELLVACMKTLYQDPENCLLFLEALDSLLESRELGLSDNTRIALTALQQADICATLGNAAQGNDQLLPEELTQAASYALAWRQAGKYEKILQTFSDKEIDALLAWTEHPSYAAPALCILFCISTAQSGISRLDERILRAALRVLAAPAPSDDRDHYNALLILRLFYRTNKAAAQALVPNTLPILEHLLGKQQEQAVDTRVLAARTLGSLIHNGLVDTLSAGSIANLEAMFLANEAVECVGCILIHHFSAPDGPYKPSPALLAGVGAALTKATRERNFDVLAVILGLIERAMYYFNDMQPDSEVLQLVYATIEDAAADPRCLQGALNFLNVRMGRPCTGNKQLALEEKLLDRLRALTLDETIDSFSRALALSAIVLVHVKTTDTHRPFPLEIAHTLNELLAAHPYPSNLLLNTLLNLCCLSPQKPELASLTKDILRQIYPSADGLLRQSFAQDPGGWSEASMASCFRIMSQCTLQIPDITLQPDLYGFAIRCFCGEKTEKNLRSATAAFIIRYLEHVPTAEIPEVIGTAAQAVAVNQTVPIRDRCNALWLLSILAQRNALPQNLDQPAIRIAAEALIAPPAPTFTLFYRDEAIAKIRELLEILEH